MRTKLLLIFGIVFGILVSLSVEPAYAQRRRGRVVVANPPVVVYGGYYRPVVPYAGFAFGQWYPYPYPYPGVGFPGPGFYRNPIANVRLQVTPREGLVYVDGYAAGMVDDFDGVFQRLQLIPGHHEIVVCLRGYHTMRQNLYLSPGSSYTVKHTMVPLGPGETDEPAPTPLMAPGPAQTSQGSRLPPGPVGPPIYDSRIGTLSLRVQPGDATIVIDGESWRGPQSQDRLSVELAEGRHQLRVEKPGFRTFAVDVDVKAGETTSLNVSLLN